MGEILPTKYRHKKRLRSPEDTAPDAQGERLYKLPKLDKDIIDRSSVGNDDVNRNIASKDDVSKDMIESTIYTLTTGSPISNPIRRSSGTFRFGIPSPKKNLRERNLEDILSESPPSHSSKDLPSSPVVAGANKAEDQAIPVQHVSNRTTTGPVTSIQFTPTMSKGAHYHVRHIVLSKDAVLPHQGEFILAEFPENFYDAGIPKPPSSTIPRTTISNEDCTHLGLVWQVKKYNLESAYIFEVFPIVSYSRAQPNSLTYVSSLSHDSKAKHIPIPFAITDAEGRTERRDVTDITPDSFGEALNTGSFINSRPSWVYARRQKIILKESKGAWRRLPNKPSIPFESLQRLVNYEDDLENMNLLKAQAESQEEDFREDKHRSPTPVRVIDLQMDTTIEAGERREQTADAPSLLKGNNFYKMPFRPETTSKTEHKGRRTYQMICDDEFYPTTSMIEELGILGLSTEIRKFRDEHETAVHSSVTNWLQDLL